MNIITSKNCQRQGTGGWDIVWAFSVQSLSPPSLERECIERESGVRYLPAHYLPSHGTTVTDDPAEKSCF